MDSNVKKDLTISLSGNVTGNVTPGSGPMSPTLSSAPLSPGAADGAGVNVAVDHMKARYEGDKKVHDMTKIILPSLVREPKKLNFSWEKVVDDRSKRSELFTPLIKEQDLVGFMLTCAGSDSGKSQYMSMVEAAKDAPPTVSHEQVETVIVDITKTVRNMFETGNVTEFHETYNRLDMNAYEQTPGSGVFENQPVKIEGVVRASDQITEGEEVQTGLTRTLLDQWTKKGTTDGAKFDKTPIRLAEAEGSVSESKPIRRDDVVREDDANAEDFVQKGITQSLLGEWQRKGTEDIRTVKRRINIAEGEGSVSENEPVRRDDVVRENLDEMDIDVVQKGTAKMLLNQWQNQGVKEVPAKKKIIDNFLGPDGKIMVDSLRDLGRGDTAGESGTSEKDLLQRGLAKAMELLIKNENPEENKESGGGSVEEMDFLHRYLAEKEQAQKGITQAMMAQWKNIDSKDFTQEKSSIDLTEAEELWTSENTPIVRSDVVREKDLNPEGEGIKKGITKSLLNQWQNKREEFRKDRTPIVVAEDEGSVSESVPVQRSDVDARANDAGYEERQIQRGFTKCLLNQWQNKRDDFSRDRTPIILAEDEGKISENEPVRRSDIAREDDALGEDKIQRGITKSLLNQWKVKGNEEFRTNKAPIKIAEDEGSVSENVPVQRMDVVREYDPDESDRVQRGITQSLLRQWSSGSGMEIKTVRKPIVILGEGGVAENVPVPRSDVVREGDAADGEQVQRGITKSLLNQFTSGQPEYKHNRQPINIADAEGKVSENVPTFRDDVVHGYDTEAESIEKGKTKTLLGQWKNKGTEQFQLEKKQIILAEDEGRVSENEPVKRTDVVNATDFNENGEFVQRGLTKNLLGQWKNKGTEGFQQERRQIIVAEDEGRISENDPVKRMDVVNATDFNENGEFVQRGLTKNLLGQWKNKGTEEFHQERRQIILAEDEGRISENDPVKRTDVVNATDFNENGEFVQRGLTQNLLGQWKNKGTEEFHRERRQIIVAEDEGRVSENDPVKRTDVVNATDSNENGEYVQRGLTQNLLGQWKNKGTEEFQQERRQIIVAEDEGRVAENEPKQRSDVVHANDRNTTREFAKRGTTQNLLGQWKTKGSEEFQQEKKQIIIAEDEGRIAENEPIKRNDVFHEYDCNVDGEIVQRGITKTLLGQWKNKGNEEFLQERRQIILAEDEGRIAESTPERRFDVVHEYDINIDGEILQRGITRSLLDQWSTKSSEEYKSEKREIIIAEDEGRIVESQPVYRSDVCRENDVNMLEEQVQRGITRMLKDQLKNISEDPGRIERKQIILAEDEGTIAENEPMQRTDIIHEYDLNENGEQVRRGATRNLLGQWISKGSESYKSERSEIIIAEDEGTIAENEPMIRDDVIRGGDVSMYGEQVQRGITKVLTGKWNNKESEEIQITRREINVAEDEGRIVESEPLIRSDVARETDNNIMKELPARGQAKLMKGQLAASRVEYRKENKPIELYENPNEASIAENQPIIRTDVIREQDDTEEIFLKRGFTKDLTGFFSTPKEEAKTSRPGQIRMEVEFNPDEVAVHENTPIERPDVVKSTDPLDEVMGKRGLIRDLYRQYTTKTYENPSKKPKDQVVIDLAEGPAVIENEPTRREDVARCDYSSAEDTTMMSGMAKNLLQRWASQDLETIAPKSADLIDGKPAWVIEMEQAPGSGVFENQPIVRTDVIREEDYEPEIIPIKQTRNTRKLWSQREQDEQYSNLVYREHTPELVRFTPPREITPPRIHQEEYKSYQTITLASGSKTPGPISTDTAVPSSYSWSSANGSDGSQHNQNYYHSVQNNNHHDFSSPEPEQLLEQIQSVGGDEHRHIQIQSPDGGILQSQQASRSEKTMKSSAVLVLKPS